MGSRLMPGSRFRTYFPIAYASQPTYVRLESGIELPYKCNIVSVQLMVPDERIKERLAKIEIEIMASRQTAKEA